MNSPPALCPNAANARDNDRQTGVPGSDKPCTSGCDVVETTSEPAQGPLRSDPPARGRGEGAADRPSEPHDPSPPTSETLSSGETRNVLERPGI